MRDLKKALLSAVMLLGLLLLFAWANRAGVLTSEAARSVIDAAGPLGPLVLGLLYSTTVIFSPLSGSPITIAALVAYGYWGAFATHYLGNLIGSSANFFIARTAGRPAVERLAGTDKMAKLDETTEATGVTALIVLRLFGGGLFDFVSYAAGLTPMRFSTYFAITNLCGIPGLLLFVYMLQKAISMPPIYTVPFTACILALTVVIPFFVYRRLRRAVQMDR
jgi:uncharacterized membrane protein YdjX (TVP38/TMEM64 family)